MTKKTVMRTIDGIEIEMGSGNVFADLAACRTFIEITRHSGHAI